MTYDSRLTTAFVELFKDLGDETQRVLEHHWPETFDLWKLTSLDIIAQLMVRVEHLTTENAKLREQFKIIQELDALDIHALKALEDRVRVLEAQPLP